MKQNEERAKIEKLKILNLYAGIGGNRKLWGDTHNITAVEYDENIANIYQDFFPKDKVVVADAHKYLLDHYSEFDFIWSSPPCPSHSRIRKELAVGTGQNKVVYPEMSLYQEILLLKHYFKGNWVVENVIAFYEPLIAPQEIASHWWWSNYLIAPIKTQSRGHHETIDGLEGRKGFDLSKYQGIDKRKTLRNCVEPEVGLHIFNQQFKKENSLF